MSPPATSPLAAGRLRASALVFFALAAAAPLTVVTTVVPAAYARGNAALVPLAFPVVGLVLLLFGAGYTAMSRRAPHPAPLAAFVARGLGRPVGVGAAGLALVSYNAVQIGLYGAVGAAAAPLLASWFGVAAPWWAVAAACWAFVALCGLLPAEAVGGVLAVLVIAGAAVMIGYAAADLLHPAAGITVPADWPAVDRPALGALLVVVAFAFLGVESVAAYGEEAARPRRTVARATTLAVVLAALLQGASAWTMSVAAGTDRVAALAAGRDGELLFDLAGARLAPWAVTLGRVLLLTGLLAALVSLHHTIARYTYALSRERLLPAVCGRTVVRGSLTQSAVAAAALAAAYLAGRDPMLLLFRRLTTAGAVGILLLLAGASLAALLFLNRVPGDEGLWRRLVAPGLATVLLASLGHLAFVNLPGLVPWAYPAVVAAGVAYGTVLRWAAPLRYAGIGLGGAAVVAARSPVVPAQRLPGAHRPERVRRVARHEPGDRQPQAR